MIISKIKRHCKLTQKIYDKIISNIDFSTIKCSKCSHSSWGHYAHYSRRVDFFNLSYKISILRVQCKVCGVTHAVLVSSMVPYTSLSHNDIISIFDPNLVNFLDIDETYLRFLISKYKLIDYFDFQSVCLLNRRIFPVIFTP